VGGGKSRALLWRVRGSGVHKLGGHSGQGHVKITGKEAEMQCFGEGTQSAGRGS
jgi:hypothetical protein